MSTQAKRDDGDRLTTAESSRLCAVLRTSAPPDQLLRFVAGPDGTIVPDLVRRLPGRGVWVTARKDTVREAVRRNVFARSLKQAVAVPDDLPVLVERLMTRRLAEAVSIANKAGLLVSGFAKVEALIEGGAAVVLIHAADGAAGGAAKLDRKFGASVGQTRADEAVVNELSGPELDLAIGRSNVVHAAASDGGASRRILQEAARLRNYRSGAAADAPESNPGRA